MASTSSNIVVQWHDQESVIQVSIASGTTLADGDLVDVVNSLVVAHSTTGNTFFAGVALGGSEAGDITPISIATKAKVLVKLVSGSSDATVGKAAIYSAGANGTDWQVTLGTVGGLMWALEAIADTYSGTWLIDTTTNGGFGLFETVT